MVYRFVVYACGVLDRLLAEYAKELEAALSDPEMGEARILLVANSLRNLAAQTADTPTPKRRGAGWWTPAGD